MEEHWNVTLGGIYNASKFTKVADVLGIAATGIGIWHNFENYKHVLGSSLVDIIVFGLGIVAGAGIACGENKIKDAVF